jgi:hypothetical protein
MAKWLTNNELERALKEAVVAKFQELSRHLHGVTGDHHEKSQDSWCLGRDLNLGPPE